MLKSSETLHRDSTYLYLIGFKFPSDLTGQHIFPQDYIFTQQALLLTRAFKVSCFSILNSNGVGYLAPVGCHNMNQHRHKHHFEVVDKEIETEWKAVLFSPTAHWVALLPPSGSFL